MKRINPIHLLFVLFTAITFNCYSQQEWASIGTTWYYDYYDQMATGYVKIESVKDTVVDSKHCKYLYITESVYEFLGGYKTYKIDSLITYQDNSKIYLYAKSKFVQLYDFNPTVGDIWETSEIPNYFNFSSLWQNPSDPPCPAGKVIVDSIKIITLNNLPKKAIFTSSYNGSKRNYNGVIIEGIGCLFYMLPKDFCANVVDIPYPANIRCYNSSGFSYSWSNKACDYLPEIPLKKWAPTDAVWHYGIVESPGNATNEGYCKFETIKDTTIQGKVCSVIRKTNKTSTGETIELGFEYMYSDKGVVYQLIKNQFYTLYNFNAQIGDTWASHLPVDINNYRNPEDSLITVHVDSIKYIYLQDEMYKSLYVSSQQSTRNTWAYKNPIIEKSGANYMFLGEWAFEDIDIPYLRCYNDNNVYYHPNRLIECESIINSVNQPNLIDFNVFPNPATNFIQLQINDLNESDKAISIYNIIGSCVLKKDINNEKDLLIDISNLNTGIYFIRCNSNKQLTIKFTKL